MKKKLGLFNGIVYYINLLVVVLVIISFLVPYIPPKSYPVLSLLSLVVSPLLLINILFLIYWLFKLNWRLVYSLVVLLIAHFHFGSYIQLSSDASVDDSIASIKLLSYNVRLFNAYEKNPEPHKVAQQFSELLKSQNPDIVSIQEYYEPHEVDFSAYPHQFVYYRENTNLGHAIFSKYPIVNQGSFDFLKSHNNTIYADLKVGNDTIRVYNLHLQSLGIIPDISTIQEEDQKKFRKRVSRAFKLQQEQVDSIILHKRTISFPTIINGDFNNTAYSYVYHKLVENFNDAFDEKGNGLGTTYLFDMYPTRIDYILSTNDFETLTFENINKTFSDHYPITASFRLKD